VVLPISPRGSKRRSTQWNEKKRTAETQRTQRLF
jgi:hypothetical protein